MPVFWAVMGLILLVLTAVPLADKHLGPRLEPDRLPGRTLRRTVAFVNSILPTRLVGVVMLTSIAFFIAFLIYSTRARRGKEA